MTKTKGNIELKRVNINLPANIVDKVKEYAETLGINTTSAYIVLLNQALEQKDMLKQMPLMISMYNEIRKLNFDDLEGNSNILLK